MPTTKALITAQELLQMPKDGYRYELIEGELKKMSPGGNKHGAEIGKFTGYLAYYVYENDLGVVCGAETGFLISTNPDTVLAPDVSFTSKDRANEEDLPDGYSSIIPDLVVEVISPSDSKKEVEKKVADWLNAGAKMVVILDPRKRTVAVHSLSSKTITLNEQANLVLDPVVPSFSYPVAKLLLKQKKQ